MTPKRILPYRKSIRLQDRDYFFGDVINRKMELNGVGEKVKELWVEIPNKFKNVALDAFVTMPNHIHGIVIIGKYWEYANCIVRDSDAINRVPTGQKGSSQS